MEIELNQKFFDLEQLRLDTPGVAHRVHLNNAGAGLLARPVLEKMISYLQREATIGGYEAAYEATADIAAVYDSVARLVGASASEIALTENATVAWQMAFYALRFEPGDRILTARAEYAANYVAFLQVARRTGAVIEVIPDDAQGVLDAVALERMIDDRVRLIAMTWMPTNSGLVNPAEQVGRIARAHRIPYLLDACQAVGQTPVDVERLGCDMLSATGRKFLRGPRGTGFLYVRKSLLLQLEPPMIDHFGAVWVAPDRYELRADARRFETWESNYAARLGLGAAVDYALEVGLPEAERRCRQLSSALRDLLREIPGIELHDPGTELSAIVSFSVQGRDAAAVNLQLFNAGMNVSNSKPSSALLDHLARQLPTVLRASPHYYNTLPELEALAAALRSTRG
jgi:cysteine desulfurase/selenocysteine lyase